MVPSGLVVAAEALVVVGKNGDRLDVEVMVTDEVEGTGREVETEVGQK